MKLSSQLFTKTRKDAPKDETSRSAELLIRAGFIYKQLAGAYVLTPLGLRVFNNIVQIIREEMNAAGGQEISMTSLQPKELWEATGRWTGEADEVWFKTQLHNKTQLGLAFTHEEAITNLMREYISSYRDLPVYAYQLQTKFRNELRAKSGIMRTREFVMKDLYSFSRNADEHEAYYEKMKDVYLKTFKRLGIGDQTFITFASGGSFSKYSHEFQTILEGGEDTIYLDRAKGIAINEEVFNDEVIKDLGLDKAKLDKVNACEVGNIFTLGTRFSDALDLKFVDEDGERKSVVMGSYGIGPARIMGVIAELLSDDKGLVWPAALAPAQVYLVAIINDDAKVQAAADKLYAELTKADISVLYDDRDVRAGEKFADAELIGIPVRLVVSEKTVSAGGIEVSSRKGGDTTLIPESGIVEHLEERTKHKRARV